MTITEQIHAVQSALGVRADGLAGPQTWAAIYARVMSIADLAAGRHSPSAIAEGSPVDARSEKAIATLLPRVRPYARALVTQAAQQGITIVVTSGTRTYAEQDALFAKANVTKARGGYSNHNFGLAFDVTIFSGGKPVWESPAYRAVGALGRALGLSWGGDWKSFTDEPHFELRPAWAASLSESQMLAELRRRHKAGEEVFS